MHFKYTTTNFVQPRKMGGKRNAVYRSMHQKDAERVMSNTKEQMHALMVERGFVKNEVDEIVKMKPRRNQEKDKRANAKKRDERER
jgi:hypothetical protein